MIKFVQLMLFDLPENLDPSLSELEFVTSFIPCSIIVTPFATCHNASRKPVGMPDCNCKSTHLLRKQLSGKATKVRFTRSGCLSWDRIELFP